MQLIIDDNHVLLNANFVQLTKVSMRAGIRWIHGVTVTTAVSQNQSVE